MAKHIVKKKRDNPAHTVISATHKPRVQQRTIMFTTDMYFSVTIIEEAYSWTPSIHLVIEDEHFGCEKMCIYGFPEGQGEHLISKVFTMGSKMHIINPYLRLGASDLKPGIRVDDFSSIIMQSESERAINMCQWCGEPNAVNVNKHLIVRNNVKPWTGDHLSINLYVKINEYDVSIIFYHNHFDWCRYILIITVV